MDRLNALDEAGSGTKRLHAARTSGWRLVKSLREKGRVGREGEGESRMWGWSYLAAVVGDAVYG